MPLCVRYLDRRAQSSYLLFSRRQHSDPRPAPGDTMPDAFTANAPSRYPDAEWQSGFKAGDHYSTGNDGRLAVALHIAEGGYISSVNFLRQQGLSAHFIVSENGSVAQMAGIHDSAWAQGLLYAATPADLPKGWTWQGVGWYSPRKKRVNPTWQLLTPGIDPNRTIISIEHAGFHNKARPAVQLAATIRLLRWLASWFPSLNPYVPGRTLIGHFNLDNLDRANCPGPHFDFAKIAKAASLSPPPRRMRFKGWPIYQRKELNGTLAGHLQSGEEFEVDVTYTNGAGHLSDQRGFVDLNHDALEELP